MRDGAPAPRPARPFVVLLLLAMTASALLVWEPWPFTSFRLFSQVRTDEQRAWEATTIGASGRELAYPLSSSPNGGRNFGFAMADFVEATQGERDAICRAWVTEAPEFVGREARAVRIYLRTWRLSERDDDRALPGERAHLFTCSRAGEVERSQ